MFFSFFWSLFSLGRGVGLIAAAPAMVMMAAVVMGGRFLLAALGGGSGGSQLGSLHRLGLGLGSGFLLGATAEVIDLCILQVGIHRNNAHGRA